MAKHEELIEKVARAICMDDMSGGDVFDGLSNPQKEQFLSNAIAAISTILAALQEPTREMRASGGNFVVRNLGRHHDVMSGGVWSAMLNASPLAGEKRGAE